MLSYLVVAGVCFACGWIACGLNMLHLQAKADKEAEKIRIQRLLAR